MALHEVADGVWAWVGGDGSWGWSNSGLITDASADPLLVDTLFDLRLTGEMLAALRQATPAATHIGTVVNTHANGDHCFGNQLVADASIVASAAAADEMRRIGATNMAELVRAAPGLGPTGAFIERIFGPFAFDGIIDTYPTRTFAGELTISVGDVPVTLVELGPADTDGDVIAVVPDRRVVFTGDLLFVGGHPIVWVGPVANWIAALDRILALDVEVVVPGHGPVTDKAGVRELRAYFVALLEAARPLWQEGLTPLQAARQLHISGTDGWGESERLVVNVSACFRDFGASDTGSTVASLFGDMAALAGFGSGSGA